MNLCTFALAAIAGQLPTVQANASEAPELQFLRTQFAEASGNGTNWQRNLSNYLQQPDESDANLFALAEALSLSLVELLAVALAAAVEEDTLVGRVLASVQ